MSNFLVGDCYFDTSRNTLFKNGQAFKLENRPSEVLCELCLHANEVVLRTYLLAHLWGGTVVTDNALGRCISQIRKGFKVLKGCCVCINVVPKKGYVLEGKVTKVSSHLNGKSGTLRASTRFNGIAIRLFKRSIADSRFFDKSHSTRCEPPSVRNFNGRFAKRFLPITVFLTILLVSSVWKTYGANITNSDGFKVEGEPPDINADG